MTDRTDGAQIPAYIAAAYEDSPIPISIYDREGTQIAINAAMERMFHIERDADSPPLNMVTEPQLAARGTAELHRRVMAGETIVLPPSIFESDAGGPGGGPARRWVEAIYFPLRDRGGAVTHLCAYLRDVTREIEQARTIEAAREEIASQRATIESLSSPVIQVWPGILTMPLVGVIDNRRALNITASLLERIAQQQADCVILDITGVPVVDTQVAQHLIQTAQACRLLGSEVVLVGISSEIAQTLVQLGVDLSRLVTLADLQAGIAWAFERLHLRVVAY